MNHFFPLIFIKKKNDIEIKKFESKINGIKAEINAVSVHSQENCLNIIEQYKEKIKKLLNERKENIKNYLKEKKYKEIIKEINEKIEKNLEGLNSQVIELIDKSNGVMNEIIKKSNSIINDFSGGKGNDLEIPGFNEFFYLNIGAKEIDFSKEIDAEIKTIFSSTYIIYEKKGFTSWIISSFSNEYYLENIIDILLSTLLSKIEYILFLFLDNITKYIPKISRLLNKNYLLVTTKFTKQYEITLKELTNDYKLLKDEINEIRKSEEE